MSTVGYIKSKIREVQPVIVESTEVLMACMEALRSCGVLNEEMVKLASSIENLEEVTNLLEKRKKQFDNFEES